MSNKTNPIFLVIDLGAESGRVISVSIDAGMFKLEEIHRFQNEPLHLDTGLHWDIYGIWSEIKIGIVKAAEKYADRIVSIGVDSWGVDFGLFDSDNTLLGNPFHYRDKRTDGVMEEVFDVIPKSKIFNTTGIQFLQINSIFQLYSTVRNKPGLLDAAETLLMIPDIFNFWMTGEKRIEFTIASTSQLLDYSGCDWSIEILEKLNIPKEILPEIIQPGTVIGKMEPVLAEELGIAKIPVIAVASHDTASAVAATPLQNNNEIFLSSGTWSLMGIEVEEPIVNDDSLKYNFTNEGGVEGTYRFLKNISGMWLVQECRRTWVSTLNIDYTYPQLAEMAGAADLNKSIIDPSDQCFFAPDNIPSAIQNYCRDTDQEVPDNIGKIVRCILESLALEYRWVAERLEEFSGLELNKIHIIGGGAQNELLNQLTADATGRIVEAGPIEATAIGSALVQAISSGYLESVSEGRVLVEKSFSRKVYEPDKDQVAELYSEFLRLKENIYN